MEIKKVSPKISTPSKERSRRLILEGKKTVPEPLPLPPNVPAYVLICPEIMPATSKDIFQYRTQLIMKREESESGGLSNNNNGANNILNGSGLKLNGRSSDGTSMTPCSGSVDPQKPLQPRYNMLTNVPTHLRSSTSGSAAKQSHVTNIIESKIKKETTDYNFQNDCYSNNKNGIKKNIIKKEENNFNVHDYGYARSNGNGYTNGYNNGYTNNGHANGRTNGHGHRDHHRGHVLSSPYANGPRPGNGYSSSLPSVTNSLSVKLHRHADAEKPKKKVKVNSRELIRARRAIQREKNWSFLHCENPETSDGDGRTQRALKREDALCLPLEGEEAEDMGPATLFDGDCGLEAIIPAGFADKSVLRKGDLDTIIPKSVGYEAYLYIKENEVANSDSSDEDDEDDNTTKMNLDDVSDLDSNSSSIDRNVDSVHNLYLKQLKQQQATGRYVNHRKQQEQFRRLQQEQNNDDKSNVKRRLLPPSPVRKRLQERQQAHLKPRAPQAPKRRFVARKTSGQVRTPAKAPETTSNNIIMLSSSSSEESSPGSDSVSSSTLSSSTSSSSSSSSDSSSDSPTKNSSSLNSTPYKRRRSIFSQKYPPDGHQLVLSH